MTEPKLYPYGCKHLSAKEIAELHPDNIHPSWVRKRIKEGKTVAELLAEPLMTRTQISRKGKNASSWNKRFF